MSSRKSLVSFTAEEHDPLVDTTTTGSGSSKLLGAGLDHTLGPSSSSEDAHNPSSAQHDVMAAAAAAAHAAASVTASTLAAAEGGSDDDLISSLLLPAFDEEQTKNSFASDVDGAVENIVWALDAICDEACSGDVAASLKSRVQKVVTSDPQQLVRISGPRRRSPAMSLFGEDFISDNSAVRNAARTKSILGQTESLDVSGDTHGAEGPLTPTVIEAKAAAAVAVGHSFYQQSGGAYKNDDDDDDDDHKQILDAFSPEDSSTDEHLGGTSLSSERSDTTAVPVTSELMMLARDIGREASIGSASAMIFASSVSSSAGIAGPGTVAVDGARRYSSLSALGGGPSTAAGSVYSSNGTFSSPSGVYTLGGGIAKSPVGSASGPSGGPSPSSGPVTPAHGGARANSLNNSATAAAAFALPMSSREQRTIIGGHSSPINSNSHSSSSSNPAHSTPNLPFVSSTTALAPTLKRGSNKDKSPDAAVSGSGEDSDVDPPSPSGATVVASGGALSYVRRTASMTDGGSPAASRSNQSPLAGASVEARRCSSSGAADRRKSLNWNNNGRSSVSSSSPIFHHQQHQQQQQVLVLALLESTQALRLLQTHFHRFVSTVKEDRTSLLAKIRELVKSNAKDMGASTTSTCESGGSTGVFGQFGVFDDANKNNSTESSTPLSNSKTSSSSRPAAFNRKRFDSVFDNVHTDEVAESTKVVEEQAMDGTLCINQYVLLAQIGEGSQAPVMLANNTETGEMCAIKIVPRPKISANNPHSALMRSARRKMKMMRREVAAMKRCRHKNAVRLMECIDDESSGSLFLIMEYLERGAAGRHCTPDVVMTLSDEEIAQKPHLREPSCIDRRYTPKTVVRFGRKLLSALQYMHNLNVCHRDLNVANILVGGDSEPKISDFGIVTLASHTAGDSNPVVGGGLSQQQLGGAQHHPGMAGGAGARDGSFLSGSNSAASSPGKTPQALQARSSPPQSSFALDCSKSPAESSMSMSGSDSKNVPAVLRNNNNNNNNNNSSSSVGGGGLMTGLSEESSGSKSGNSGGSAGASSAEVFYADFAHSNAANATKFYSGDGAGPGDSNPLLSLLPGEDAPSTPLSPGGSARQPQQQFPAFASRRASTAHPGMIANAVATGSSSAFVTPSSWNAMGHSSGVGGPSLLTSDTSNKNENSFSQHLPIILPPDVQRARRNSGQAASFSPTTSPATQSPQGPQKQQQQQQQQRRQSVVHGTVAYSAPELHAPAPPGEEHEPLDLFQADCFSMGLTIYSLLFGRLPWRANPVYDYLQNLVSKDVPFPPGWQPGDQETDFFELQQQGGARPPLAEGEDPADDCDESEVPEELLEILRGMLHRDPTERLTVEEARLKFKDLCLHMGCGLEKSFGSFAAMDTEETSAFTQRRPSASLASKQEDE